MFEIWKFFIPIYKFTCCIVSSGNSPRLEIRLIIINCLGLGSCKLFPAVSLMVSSNRLKKNSGSRLFKMLFIVFKKLPLVNDLNSIIGVNERYSAVNGCM